MTSSCTLSKDFAQCTPLLLLCLLLLYQYWEGTTPVFIVCGGRNQISSASLCLKCCTIEGGAHAHFVGAWISKQSMESSAVRHFKCGNAIKICNGIIFNFYMGLLHVCNTWSMQSGLGTGVCELSGSNFKLNYFQPKLANPLTWFLCGCSMSTHSFRQ